MARGFAAQLADFEKVVDDRLRRILRKSMDELLTMAQRPIREGGRIPVESGYLRASLELREGDELVTTLEPLTRTEAQAFAADRPEGDTSIIEAAEVGKLYTATWRAPYAIISEFGSGRNPGYLSVTAASANWQQIVARVAQRIAAEPGRL